eukprot:6208364-Pleurochrysis_carterae.AAC.6
MDGPCYAPAGVSSEYPCCLLCNYFSIRGVPKVYVYQNVATCCNAQIVASHVRGDLALEMVVPCNSDSDWSACRSHREHEVNARHALVIRVASNCSFGRFLVVSHLDCILITISQSQGSLRKVKTRWRRQHASGVFFSNDRRKAICCASLRCD